MDTLPNVNTRRGGENPSSAGLTSCALPEAQGAPGAAICSEGESSNFIPKDRPQWFVLRATHGRWKKAVDLLEDNDIETYVPMHDITKLINGKRRTFHEPLLPDIVFARLSRTMAEQFVKDPAPLLKMAEILHRQNQTPRKRHRPQSSHRHSRQRNAQLHQSHQCPQRA